MLKFSFLKTVSIISLLFTFITIYQHNQVVQLKYAQQRLSKKRGLLLAQKNRSRVQLCALTNPEVIKDWALNDQHMQELSYAKTFTLNTNLAESV